LATKRHGQTASKARMSTQEVWFATSKHGSGLRRRAGDLQLDVESLQPRAGPLPDSRVTLPL
jgi:hypothetical protein